MANLHGNMHVFVHFKIYMKAPKHARFHVFSPFSAPFYPPPPLHHIGKGIILVLVSLSQDRLRP